MSLQSVSKEEREREKKNDDQNKSENEDAKEKYQKKSESTVKFLLLEDIILLFDDCDNCPVEKFELKAKLFNWSNTRKLLFAKNKLTGLAVD